MFKIIESKKGTGVCAAYRCKNKPGKWTTLCEKHRKRRIKELNPLSYVYSALKNNARRRGKAFSLTLQEFKKFCDDTGYLDSRGRKGESMTIDRIDASKGYSLDNICILSHKENSTKGASEKECPF